MLLHRLGRAEGEEPGAKPALHPHHGRNTLDGTDVVVEGQAVLVEAPAELGAIADAYESKYGAHFTDPAGTWFGLGDTIRTGDVLVYRVAPETAFGFGKGTHFSQTRWRFT